jgi:low affinity Fe/Cu permease
MNAKETQRSAGAFERAADLMSESIGRPGAFISAVLVIVAWASLGPIANFSDTWQLIINTGTTIVTFLMVFLLGNASNRITKSQDRLLTNIYGEEQRLETEERLIRRLLDRIDIQHVQPILKHLDDQDHLLEQGIERVIASLSETPES